MNDFSNEIKKSDIYQKVRKSPFLWSILTFIINDIIIKTAKDLLDDGKLNNSVK